MKEVKVTRLMIYLFLGVFLGFLMHNSYERSKSEMILEENKDMIPLQEEVQELFDDVNISCDLSSIKKADKTIAYVFSISEDTNTLPCPLNTFYEFNTNDTQPVGKMLRYYWNREQKTIYKEDDLEIYSIYVDETKKDNIVGRFKRGPINVYFFSDKTEITDHDIDLLKQMFKIAE